MKTADVFVQGTKAGILTELSRNRYEFKYDASYEGPPISLTLPLKADAYEFASFPAFFDGLLPEGAQQEALLRQKKIDRNDFFSQLLAVGEDLVGAVTVRARK